MLFEMILVYVIATVIIVAVLVDIRVEKTNAVVVNTAIIAVAVMTVTTVIGMFVKGVVSPETTQIDHIQVVGNTGESGLFTGSLIGAVVVAVSALLVGSIRDRHSKNELYTESVSSFRMDWIKAMRKHLVDLIVLCKTINSYEVNNDEKVKNKIAFERCRANILMRLNPTVSGELSNANENLKILLKKMRFDQNQICVDENIIKEDFDDVEKIGTALLKEEWERVKVEAGETIKKRKEIDLRTKKIKTYKESVHSTN